MALTAVDGSAALHAEFLPPSAARWAQLYAELPAASRDVFYSPGFAELCQTSLNAQDRVLCAVASTPAGPILYPFALRDLEQVTGSAAARGFCDITGLYGRGGIVCDPAAVPYLPAFHQAVRGFCTDHRVICGFDRFHPVIDNDAFADAAEKVTEIGGFVVASLEGGLEAIKSRHKSSVRNDYRRAERFGVTAFCEENVDHLDDFMRLYSGTMDRRGAREFYYFERSYFEQMARLLPGNFTFFYAVSDGQIISTDLILHDGLYAHLFLSGTDSAFQSLCANPLLKQEIFRHFSERGATHFLLGGGTAPDDSLFRYKRAYAPNGVLPSRIGGTVFDTAGYATLKEKLVAENITVHPNRFQYYDPS